MKLIYTAYDLNRLGYFKSREAAVGYPSVKEILGNLVSWGRSVTQINNTKTYAPSSKTTNKATFFADGHHDEASGETVIVLWKEVNSNRGDVYGLSRSTKPGQGQVATRSFDYDKYIPGFPIYFWFRPSDNKMFALEFEHSDRGKLNLEHFVLGYLRWRAQPWCLIRPRVKVNENNYSRCLLGYSYDGDKQNLDDSVAPYVDITINKSGDTLQKLLAARPVITRLQRVEAIEFSDDAGENRTLSERVYEDGIFKGLMPQPRKLSKVRYKSEITWKPTEEEIVELYNNVSEIPAGEGLENLSAITNEQKSISFLGNAVREEINIALPEKFDGFVPAASLYLALDSVRQAFP